MKNNFEQEIIALSENKNIRYKLRIFSIYCDFYNTMISSLSFGYNHMVSEYKTFMTECFMSTIEVMNLKTIDTENGKITCGQFISYFLDLVSDNMLSNRIPFYEIINSYKS